MMGFRAAKVLLVFGVALRYTLIVFDNLTDYDSNFEFVRHVMMMDTTSPGNHAMWRAVNSPTWHTAFYLGIIAWESLTAVLCWWGGLRLVRTLRANAVDVRRASGVAIAGLTSGLLMWLVAFLAIGGEWFLMWQSNAWSGQGAAYQMFTMLGIVLILLVLPESNGTV
jgi:predicted small integral membrane protein